MTFSHDITHTSLLSHTIKSVTSSHATPATLAAPGTRATAASPAASAPPRFAACITSQPQEQPRHSHTSSHTILATHTSPQQPKLACSCAPRAQSAGTYGDREKELKGIHDARLVLDLMNLSICLSLFSYLRAWGRRWVE